MNAPSWGTLGRFVVSFSYLSLLASAGGCGGGATSGPDDGGGLDANVDAGGCHVDDDCSDGVFCNGLERCEHGAAGADANGCVPPPTASPCLAAQTCDEANDACVTSCGAGGSGDADGDGHRAATCGGDDCDDADPNTFPGRPEVCDAANHDEDCDPTTFGFRDADGDSYADATCCNVSSAGGMNCGDDCNDSRPNVHPFLPEACDGLDNDCNTAIDEGVERTFYPDVDADGYGDSSAPTSAWMMGCIPPAAFSEMGGDCDDASSAIHPGALEQCDVAMADENCDGVANPTSLCACAGDVTRGCATLGGLCASGTERCIGGSWGLCSIQPSTEVCNGVDDDCDASVDETLSVTCYPDGDNDGYADPSATAGQTCPVPGRDGFAGCPPNQTNRPPLGSTSIDCNDGDSTINPGAPELCDVAMVDEDCDGISNPATLCACTDGDSRACTAAGSCGAGNQTCTSGHWSTCSVNPVPESCNGVDDNCNGTIDEGLTVTCYADGDNDGFAAAGAMPIASCPVMGRTWVGGCPTGQTNVAPGAGTTDCNDTAPTINPSAAELCDMGMIDENCDGTRNPISLCACSGATVRGCTLSGACSAGTQTCASGSWGLCSILPITESCNGVDDDCDGMTDELLIVTCYADVDNDGYAASGAAGMSRCPDSARPGGCPAGTTFRQPTGANVDCNDADASRSPGATEGCNGIDDNCNGTIDEGATITCYAESDGDGYAPAASTAMQRCADPTRGAFGSCPLGTTSRAPGAGGTDCNDANAAVSPAAVEVCDAAMIDENCDGVANPAALCACSGSATRPCMSQGACASGTQTCGGGMWGACSISPVTEVCNGVDDNCNGMTDESLTVACYGDADGDTYGAGSAVQRCPDASRPSFGNCPSGYTGNATDCNDANASIRPGATEVCNGVDDNCAGGIDEGVTASGCYVDADNDTYGAGSAVTVCRDGARPGGCSIGYYNRAGDCNDARSLQNPGVAESCNGLDDNCNGMIDEGVLNTYYRDADSDGYGSATTMQGCSAPAGYVAASGDCNDANATIHPGATELCDGIDQNCASGTTDEPTRTFYRDSDGDLYGTLSTTVVACTPPAGYVENSSDCDDTTTAAHPGGTEICDPYDNDCDGTLDESPATGYCPNAYPGAANVGAWACGGAMHACSIGSCAAGYADCDGSITNGCEANLNSDAANCGSCGRACSVGGVCGGGHCPAVSDLLAGSNTACVVYTSGNVACWGDNSSGRAGTGSSVPSTAYSPIAATQFAPIVSRLVQGQPGSGVAGAGDGSVMFVSGGSTYYGVGLNQYGQLGDGTTISPRFMPSYAGVSAAGSSMPIAIGSEHTCRVSGSFGVDCVGRDEYGQLGDGAGVTVSGGNWVGVSLLSGASAGSLTAGTYHTCVRTSNGVQCWGLNTNGQLGNGGIINQFSPVQVLGVGGVGTLTVNEVVAGFEFTCGSRSTDNRVVCWGDNANGQLGDASTTDRLSPVLTGTLVNSHLAAGWRHACSMSSTGGLSCWGINSSGQLGDGTTTQRTSPVAVPLTSVTDVAATAQGTCAMTSTTTAGTTTQQVYCWGHGPIGDGTLTTRSSPTLVLTVVSP